MTGRDVGAIASGAFVLAMLAGTGLAVVRDRRELRTATSAGRQSWIVPAGVAGALLLLLAAATCEATRPPPRAATTSGNGIAPPTLSGTAPCLPTSTTLRLSAKGLLYSTGIGGCLAAPVLTPFSISFDNMDRGVQHNVGIFAGPRMYSINSPTLFRGRLVEGPGTVVYHVPALTPGLWTFHCDIHPDQMYGAFVVPLVVTDSGFSPPRATMTQGNSMAWWFSLQDRQSHTVTDASGVFGGPGGDLDSGVRQPGSSFTFRFLSAGSYPVVDRRTSNASVIEVPLRIRPTPGMEGLHDIVWSLMDALPPFVFDVQILRPGSATFAAFRQGETVASAGFMPDAGPGRYEFRARLRNRGTGKASGWSPPAMLEVR
jgi:hypothetical protein